MTGKTLLLVTAGLAVSAVPAAADAAILQFDFIGDDDRSFNFLLDDERTPDGGVTFGTATRIEYDNVEGIFVGLNGTDNVADISFGTGFLSTLQVGSINFAGVFNGPDLFNGSRFDPEFNLGEFTLTPGALTPAGGTLVISQVADVPEPAALGLLALGLLGMGALMRRSPSAH